MKKKMMKYSVTRHYKQLSEFGMPPPKRIIKNLYSEENAVKETLQILKSQGYTWTNIKYLNKGRYCIVFGVPIIAILLKTEPFFNFGKKFKELGQSGVGDSINCTQLKEFIKLNVQTIYTMFRDGKLYKVPLQKFLQNSIKWTQKEGTDVRSISIHLYKRVN